MYAPVDETIMKYVPDYRVNLIAHEQILPCLKKSSKNSKIKLALHIKSISVFLKQGIFANLLSPCNFFYRSIFHIF